MELKEKEKKREFPGGLAQIPPCHARGSGAIPGLRTYVGWGHSQFKKKKKATQDIIHLDKNMACKQDHAKVAVP